MSRVDTRVYSELYYIINMLTEENRNKIPTRLMNLIEQNRDTEYEFSIDNMNHLSPDTSKILSVIYTDYIVDEEERKIIKAKEEMIKRELTMSDNIKFKEEMSHNMEPLDVSVLEEPKSLQPYEKKNIFKIFIEKLKKLFKK
ncbi:MAG: hypothetical protein IJS47_06535 [Clostridia bacterium]|nr:hypothetical protein [Clostridia bacterium]